MQFLFFLILEMVIFVVFVMVLRMIFAKKLTEATAHLQGLSAEYSRRQEDVKQRLEESERQYKEQMARAKTEAEQLVGQARQEADASKSKLLDEAHKESERIVQQAMQSRDAIRKELEQQMEARALERACELIQEVLPGQIRQEIQAHWVDELLRNGLAQLEQVKTQEEIAEARVVSAFPLNPEQRKLLRERLKEKFRRELAIHEEANPQLVAGLTITLGSLVLDGSLASKVQQAARHAQNAARA